MSKQLHRYKVTGTVRFSVDDIFDDTSESAKEMSLEQVLDNVEVAINSGTCKLLEVEAEDLGGCSEEELRKYGFDEEDIREYGY